MLSVSDEIFSHLSIDYCPERFESNINKVLHTFIIFYKGSADIYTLATAPHLQPPVYPVTMHKVRVVVFFLQLFVSNFLIVLVDATFNYDCKETLADRVHIVPLYYKLKLNLSEENSLISGESLIFINIQEDTQRLGFDSFVSVKEVALDKITPNISNIQIEGPYVSDSIDKTMKPKKTYQLEELGFVTVVFNELIQSGLYILRIKFSSVAKSTNTDGYIRASSNTEKGEVKWILATQTQVKGPQAIIPCWDNPRFKTVFDVSVLHHMMYRVVFDAEANSHQAINGSDMIWSHFESDHTMSAHCLDIAVVPRFETYAWNEAYNFTLTMPVGLQVESLPDFDFAYDFTVEVIKYLRNQNLVDQCKVEHTRYIPVRNFSRVVLATPTFILYREENIIVSNETSTKLTTNIARLIAEQITYQWIRRSTNPLYWSSSRLKDMSKFLAIYIPQKVFPKLKVRYWQLQNAYKNYGFIDNALFFKENDIQFSITSKSNSFCDI